MSYSSPFSTSEDVARSGMQTLEQLHEEGGISLFAWALIARGGDGKITVKQASGPAPLAAALGLLAGAVVGAAGGPAGSAVGAMLGHAGLLADWVRSGIDLKFLDDVGKTLTTGKAAGVAEIEESRTWLRNSKLRNQGGVICRRFERTSPVINYCKNRKRWRNRSND